MEPFSRALAATKPRRRAPDPELSAYLRDEYRGRMPRETFLALVARQRRTPFAWSIRAAVRRLARFVGLRRLRAGTEVGGMDDTDLPTRTWQKVPRNGS